MGALPQALRPLIRSAPDTRLGATFPSTINTVAGIVSALSSSPPP